MFKLIGMEGADGCGKDTVADIVAKMICGRKINFPCDDTVTGPMIRSYLRGEWGNDSDLTEYQKALALQSLMITNRMEMMPEIEALKNENTPVVLARYWQSAWVYGQLDGLPPEFLFRTHLTMIPPDLSILLDVDPEESMRRRAARDGDLPPERYEGKLEVVRGAVDLYREIWADGDYHVGGSWHVVDANRPILEVVGDVVNLVFQSMQEVGG